MKDLVEILGWLGIAALLVLPGSLSYLGGSEQEAVQRWAWLVWIASRGVAIGLAVLAFLWLRVLTVLLWRRVVVGGRFKRSGSQLPTTRPPSDLPAAAVSVLESREATPRTLLTTIVEMCENGDMKIIGEAYDGNEGSKQKGKYTYRLIPSGYKWEWEQTLCRSLPFGKVSVRSLSHWLGSETPLIGTRLGEFLQRRGYFSVKPTSTLKLVWTNLLEWIGITLMGIGLAAVVVVVDGTWWAKAHLLFVASAIYLFAWWVAREVIRRQSKIPPTDAGTEEIGRWMRLKQYLKSLARAEASSRTGRLLPYAVALNVAQPWLNDEVDAPPWFEVASAESSEGKSRIERREAYHEFMSAKWWKRSGTSGWPVTLDGGSEGGADGGDVGFDF